MIELHMNGSEATLVPFDTQGPEGANQRSSVSGELSRLLSRDR
jgi:hypothetical protein